MCSVAKQPAPAVPAAAPTLPALRPPVEAAAGPDAAASDAKRRQAAAYGRGKTILTGSEGDTSSYQAAKKSLLGL